jgi:hypothetical protein
VHDAQCGCERGVLVRIVEHVDLVERMTLARGKSFHRFQRVSDRLTGCYYSFAGGFKTNPIMMDGELELSVLLTAVSPDHLPHEMIKSATEIVNSVAYCGGEYRAGRATNMNGSGWLSSYRMFLGSHTVRIGPVVIGELPFKVSDVMVGPFDL